jgi:hypothetical protein
LALLARLIEIERGYQTLLANTVEDYQMVLQVERHGFPGLASWMVDVRSAFTSYDEIKKKRAIAVHDLLSKFFGEKLLKAEPLNVPLMPQKMDLFSMSCELYWPSLKTADLAQEEDARRQQIEAEGQKIKTRMNEMLKSL